MKKTILVGITLLCSAAAFAQPYQIAWETTGTGIANTARSIKTTPDGGFVVVGSSGSYQAGYDFYITKHDASGNVLWEKPIDDENFSEQALGVVVTADGGFAIVGNAEKAGTPRGIWVIKLSAAGDYQWDTPLGGGGLGVTENKFDIQQTADGGYVVAGNRAYTVGWEDFYIVKLDPTGVMTWEKHYGGNALDYASSIRQTPDGGYIVLGQTYSNDRDVTGQHGNGDFWLVRLDAQGDLVWQKTLGGSGVDFGMGIELTTDGGFIAVGFAGSNSGDVTGVYGGPDVWIVKLTNLGVIQWQKAFGGDRSDIAYAVKQTADGGYLAAGRTYSNSGWVVGHHGSVNDMWVVKVSANGTFEWQKPIGGTMDDEAYDLAATADGGYLLAGDTYSNDGDVSNFHSGSDAWVVKLMPQNLAAQTFANSKFTIAPNPVKNTLKIHNPAGAEIRKITITDLSGKIIREQNGASEVNVEQLQRGLYLLQLEYDSGKQTEKFIKE